MRLQRTVGMIAIAPPRNAARAERLVRILAQKAWRPIRPPRHPKASLRTGNGDGHVICRCGDFTFFPLGESQCNSGFAAGRLVRNPHGAVVQATSATLLEDDRNLDRLAPAPLARELDPSDRMNPFRNPLEADHSKDALAQARCSDRRRELRGTVTWSAHVLPFPAIH